MILVRGIPTDCFNYLGTYFLNFSLHWYSDRRLDYSGLKFSYGDGSDDEGHPLASELPSCVYAAARSRLQLPLAAYVHQHTRQLHAGL